MLSRCIYIHTFIHKLRYVSIFYIIITVTMLIFVYLSGSASNPVFSHTFNFESGKKLNKIFTKQLTYIWNQFNWLIKNSKLSLHPTLSVILCNIYIYTLYRCTKSAWCNIRVKNNYLSTSIHNIAYSYMYMNMYICICLYRKTLTVWGFFIMRNLAI